ncbi:MAG: baseplate J/gp47 family protein, partial [Myxococcota bacterium]
SGVTEIGPFNAEVSETGPQGNIASNVLDTVDGYPALTVTNTLFVGGALQETDEVFRARLRAYPNSLQRGTRAALRQGALSVPGVSFAAVDERFARPDQGGYVAVYIGDPDAQANAALVSAVEDELVNWQSSGIWVRVFAAAREEVALSLSVTVRRGSNAVAIEAAVRAAVLAYTNQLEPGETLYLSQVLAAAVRASGDVITARIPSPTADITPSVDQNAVRVLTSALSIALVEQDAD